MKFLKKTGIFILCIFTLCLCVVSAHAETTGIEKISVEWTIGENKQTIYWQPVDEKYFLFLPGNVDLQTAQMTIAADADVYYNDTLLDAQLAVATFPTGEAVVLTSGENTYSLTILQGSSIPSLHITTQSGSMDAVHADKSHKEPAEIVILSDGEVYLEKELEYIKGRGNSTWVYDKKPYNIKFDKKTDLFGMGKAKKWTLLANYRDTSLIRNFIALDIAERMEIEFTSGNIFTDLYVNGIYYGNYLLCESVEVGETRVDITDLEGETEDVNDGIDLDTLPLGGDHTKDYLKLTAATQKWVNIPKNPADISGGYLLEYDLHSRYVSEVSGFVTEHMQCVVIKSPEYASKEQVRYISDLYQDFENAVFSETGYNEKGKHYSEYIDMESFVKMYVFQEYVKNLDAGISSFYIYKNAGDDKFYAAPVWDFDNALGKTYTSHGMSLADPNGWWASVSYYDLEEIDLYVPTILSTLFRHDDFYEKAAALWNESVSGLVDETVLTSYTTTIADLAPSATMDCVLWNHYASSDPATVSRKYTTYCNDRVLQFVQDRKVFLDKGFADTTVRVLYEANGGTGVIYNTEALQLQELLTLPCEGISKDGMYFAGWNSEPDGSGKQYGPNSVIQLKENTYRFYAQWVKDEADIYSAVSVDFMIIVGRQICAWFEQMLQSLTYLLHALSFGA